MPVLVDQQTLHGVLFHFFRASTLTHFPAEPEETYFYWERQDLPVGAIGRVSFLPSPTLAACIGDATDEVA